MGSQPRQSENKESARTKREKNILVIISTPLHKNVCRIRSTAPNGLKTRGNERGTRGARAGPKTDICITLHTLYIVSQVVTVPLTHKHKIPFAISVVTTDGEWVS